MSTSRAERMSESFYKIECHACGHTVTLPAVDGAHNCPSCGAVLQLAWSAERASFQGSAAGYVRGRIALSGIM